MPGRPARHVSRITMRISSFHFPPTPWHTPLLFLCAAAVFAAAQSAFWPAGGGALPTLFTPYWLVVWCALFSATSTFRVRGSADSACGRCAWPRSSTCAIFLSHPTRLIKGLVCCVRYPTKAYPPGGRMAARRMLLWYEDLALDGGLASAQRHSRFATGIPTTTHSTT